MLVALLAAAMAVHAHMAIRLSSERLLEHDEAISLLVSAGQAETFDTFNSKLNEIQTVPAERLQAMLRPGDEASVSDVFRSLASFDIHPPLYFTCLHVLQRCGIDSQTALRIFGSLLICLAALAANRWIWPQAPFIIKLLATLWLVLAPVTIDFATELRQYPLVFLGTILSFAALIAFNEVNRSPKRIVPLLIIAPIILLYSQYGTAIWITVCLLALLAMLPWADKLQRRSFLASLVITAAIIAPLIAWRVQGHVDHGHPAPLDASLWVSSAVQPVLKVVGRAWCSVPDRLRFTPAWLIAGSVVLIASGVLMCLRSSRIDRVLWCMAVVWGLAWIALITQSIVPLHSIEPKQLAPLMLCPLFVLARATAPGNSRFVRISASIILLASLATHGIGVVQQLSRPKQPSVAALREADCLLATVPKRGYLLPMADRMRPDAKIIIASPAVALAHWEELIAMLPEDRLLYAEIDIPSSGRPPVCDELMNRLGGLYADRACIRDEPKKTITAFRHRSAASEAHREDPHG